ncbi:MAG: GIY-YIG nuclease family protein [Bacteroidota bacterium]|nr:GIY-YIG nuclease family protein [Bacteroidota bacterium]
MRMQYYVYILSSKKNAVLYIGVTNNLKRRVEEHAMGLISGFTKRYNVHKLVYYECFNYVKPAIRREKHLKKWNREWKNQLINEMNSSWQDLSNDL